ncbi:MAG: AAA family ATPase [Rhodospirillaceae bacterium]|nr:AAA family ATPase [Rhodospirillaceae bacterium]MYH37661.1 AAA family ATPase [Rhodospirillaceae bacterium]MYK12612.1 AAA family ATPase [Rhodospirillaceae bacterium]
MEREELIERLKGYEWNDIEFKEAQRDVPRSAYETVSAFSNTEGGWLVFGIRDGVGGFEIVGVVEVDKVQNDFLGVLRSGQKLNRVIAAEEQLIEHDEKVLLVFHIPEARRQEKPVYLNRDITRSYLRRGARDERCTPAEIERLLRDAADERHDGRTVDLDPERCFDDASVDWYRKLFDDRNPDHDATHSHLEFLHHWGLVVEADGRLLPTRAAVLLFGAPPAFRQVLPRPVVDWQRHRGDWSEELADERWADRLVIETNLVTSWQTLLDRYMQHAEKPFSVDPETLRREDRPPDYIAFREAAINLLMHQDYADHARKPAIRFFDDRTIFWNPGDAFVSTDELFEPGERDVRNPRIVSAFRRIGLSEQAGTGIRAIFGNWRQLGQVPPVIDNDKARMAFQLILLKEVLLSEEQLLFQAGLGVRLDDAEAKAFAFACREGELRPRDVRAVTGLSGAQARTVLERLTVQRLVSPLEGAEAPVFVLADHLKERLGRTDQTGEQVDARPPDSVTQQIDAAATDLVTEQVARPPKDLSTVQVEPLTELSALQWGILEFCDVPRRLTEIMSALGVANRGYFKKRHLDPLIRANVVAMTNLKNPRASNQRYVVTEAGARLKAGRIDRNPGRRDGGGKGGA